MPCVEHAPEQHVPIVSTTMTSSWRPLIQGPSWQSFEQFRVSGTSALESIAPCMVATLYGKTGCFRILRDEDFQAILGLASDVHRIKDGVTFILKAARLAVKHKDDEHMQLLMSSVSLLSESTVLPEREGHGGYEISLEEAANNMDDDIIPASKTPRPKL